MPERGRRFFVVVLAGRMAGQGEEHVVEGRLVHFDVVDGDTGLVQGAHHCGGETGPAPHRGPEATSVLAHVDGSGHEGLECRRRGRRRLAESDLEPGAAGVRFERGRGPVGDHPAVVDDHDPVGQLVGLIEVLGGEQQGHAVGNQEADDVPHPDPTGRVESCRGLIEEEHGRPCDQAGGEVEAAAHAPGIPLEDPVGGVDQVELVEELGGPDTGVGPPEPAQPPNHHQVLTAGQQPVHGGVLGGDPDAALDGGGLADHVVAGHPGGAGIRRGQRGQNADRRGLAGTIGPEHREDGARRYVQVHAGQGHGLAVALDQSLRMDRGLLCHDGSLPAGQQVG